eukprot:3167969-Rhodomonas_salina.1
MSTVHVSETEGGGRPEMIMSTRPPRRKTCEGESTGGGITYAKLNTASTCPELPTSWPCSSETSELEGQDSATNVAEMDEVGSASAPGQKITAGFLSNVCPMAMMTITPPVIGHLDGTATKTGRPVGVVSTTSFEPTVLAFPVESVWMVIITVAKGMPSKALAAASTDTKLTSRARLASARACSCD